MTRNSTEQLIHTYLTDIAVAGNLGLIDELFHPDLVDEAAIAFGGPHGRKGLNGHVIGFRKHITNPTVTIENIIGNDDQVMAQWSFSGIHDGPWLNQPPTHQEISGTVFSYFTVKNGLVTRYRLWLCAKFDRVVTYDSSLPLDQQGLASSNG